MADEQLFAHQRPQPVMLKNIRHKADVFDQLGGAPVGSRHAAAVLTAMLQGLKGKIAHMRAVHFRLVVYAENAAFFT